MKLYTEEQVRELADMVDGYRTDELMASLSPIELPSDEEIEKWAKQESKIEPTGAEEFGRIFGAKWVIEQIKQEKKL